MWNRTSGSPNPLLIIIQESISQAKVTARKGLFRKGILGNEEGVDENKRLWNVVRDNHRDAAVISNCPDRETKRQYRRAFSVDISPFQPQFQSCIAMGNRGWGMECGGKIQTEKGCNPPTFGIEFRLRWHHDSRATVTRCRWSEWSSYMYKGYLHTPRCKDAVARVKWSVVVEYYPTFGKSFDLNT